MNEEIEIWRDIPGFEGIYEISNFGLVKSLRRVILCKYKFKVIKEKILSPCSNQKGYLIVNLSKKGISNITTIHALMAKIFLNHTAKHNILVINHIDGNKLNNKLSNLEIVTVRENATTCFVKGNENFSSKYVGVSKLKNYDKWVSLIYINRKHLYLGCFNSEIEASEAYQNELAKIDK